MEQPTRKIQPETANKGQEMTFNKIVCISVSTSLQKRHPLFFSKSPLP